MEEKHLKMRIATATEKILVDHTLKRLEIDKYFEFSNRMRMVLTIYYHFRWYNNKTVALPFTVCHLLL